MEHTIKLDNDGLAGFELTIRAAKYGANVRVSATVSKVDGAFRTFRVYRDYSKTLTLTPCKRVTDKALQAALDDALTQSDYIREQVRGHYAAVTASGEESDA